MIQAKELRLGNWVNRQFWNPSPTEPGCAFEACSVFLIRQETINVVLKSKEIIKVPIDKLSPIPLTPEILEKCGFKVHRNSNGYWTFWTLPNSWHIAESHHNEESAGVEVHGFYWSDEYKRVYHLHQLQNIYFDLTGQELTVNL